MSIFSSMKMTKIGEYSTIKDFKDMDDDIKEILQEAVAASKFAYVPYSNFSVGAALRTTEGLIYSGCNVENVAYPMALCAERTAICKAVSEGKKKFKAIAVIGEQKDSFVTPCGACRQVIAEFGLETDVYLSQPELSKVMITSIKELLPYPFTLDHTN